MITVGIDEVGRGCWAGPLVAGAVILPSGLRWEVRPPKTGFTGAAKIQLRDSKKLTKQQRETLAAIVHRQAIAIGLGWVWPPEIDSMGVTTSVRLAMERAFAAIIVPYDEIIIDGNINYFPDNPLAKAVIKADDSVPSVSAASIVAKVARDAYMAALSEKYSGYGFEKHVGYGTATHIAALAKLGVSDIHRRSYKPIQVLLA